MHAMNQNPEQDIKAIEQYGINLTELAAKGKIDPVIGRDNEIRRMIQILSRRNKNNPVLIGEPGTGKTTVIEGLAKRIFEGDVPDTLKNKQIISLDLSAMIAGAMYRGQFEERVKNFIKEAVDSNGDLIIFIDELHTIVGAGAIEGQMDVSNMIKPELARGRMKVIGATTLKEYQKYIEKDAALERRFQQVYIAEPSVEDTVTILRGIKDRYELHHGIRIQDSALIAAANLSQRYITERFLPDKAVDLMDEAAAKIKMEINSAPQIIDESNRQLLKLQIEREALNKEKDVRSRERLKEVSFEIEAMKVKLNELNSQWQTEKERIQRIQELNHQMDELNTKMERAQRDGDYQTAAKLQYNDIPLLGKTIDSFSKELGKNKYIKLEVDPEDIAEVVSKWTGVPVTRLIEGEKEKLLRLEDSLRKRVIGQDDALQRVSDMIRMSKTGVIPQDRPLGSFLFLGSTGVGKTELAKSLAHAIFDDEKALVRIDMSEYMEAHSIAKLIGSPPGYVGYDEGGQLTEKIRRRPYSVILFDEIEKADPDVLNMLLQILDDGRLTDSKGRTVNFLNTILILTTNLKKPDLPRYLRPELMNRIDDIIQFNDLTPDAVLDIVRLRLKEVQERLKNGGLQLDWSDDLPGYIASHSYEPQFGARPIQRFIKHELLSKLSKYLLKYPELRALMLTVNGDTIRFEQSAKTEAAIVA